MKVVAPPPHDGRLAIRKLTDARRLTQAEVETFLAEHTFPIVEGPSCTFVYRGAAQSVNLRHFIYGLPSTQPFESIRGTDLWYLTLELPYKSRIEYKIEVHGRMGAQLVEDPLNPLKAHDPFGANSVCHTAGYEIPAWTLPDTETREGTIEEHVIPSVAFGDDRPLSVYLPARFRKSRRYPLLLVHDGGDFLSYASLKTVLDNLIHRLEIPQMVVALQHPGKRLVEYADDERHARHVSEELLPWLEKKYPLLGTPASRCLMGSSFGAVASFTTAHRYPDLWGNLLLLSGSFAFTDIGPNQRGPAFEPVVAFMNEYRNEPVAVADRVYVGCGTYESLIYENRSIVPLLQTTGMEVRYEEARDGHNWENWRDRLRTALSWLFPGPLWMVYE